MDAYVVLPQGPLELLVTFASKKEHESILATKALPSHLHAALLALGLAPGRPVRFALDPQGQRVTAPPAGALLDISLRYTDAQGHTVTQPANEWMLSLKDDKPVAPMHWVFAGSDILEQGGYWADLSGNQITVSNFPDACVDVPFDSTTDNAALDFAANPAAIPPLATPVTVVIRPVAGADKADVAPRPSNVDRFGRYSLDGLKIALDEVEPWAAKFKARHAKPYVVLNVSPRALVYNVERLKDILAEQDIYDVQVNMNSLAGEVLPRTPEQMARSLDWWAKQFEQYTELIREPGQQASVVLRQIETQKEDLGDLIQLWTEYDQRLTKALAAYHAATQPAAP